MKQTHRNREQISGYHWRDGRGEEKDGGRGLRGKN